MHEKEAAVREVDFLGQGEVLRRLHERDNLGRAGGSGRSREFVAERRRAVDRVDATGGSDERSEPEGHFPGTGAEVDTVPTGTDRDAAKSGDERSMVHVAFGRGCSHARIKLPVGLRARRQPLRG